ncbi:MULTISPECIES: hypothetical protein [Alphaproteobacteria]|jgi:hypothetical protein|uniref:hypothetical protein n=1 Tax=Alphaproteobacteria TaxID=28211 RepID=UPI003267B17D
MTNQEQQTRQACDQIIHDGALMMIGHGASIATILDRLLTFSAGQACKIDGAFNTAKAFRAIADQIEAGVFNHLEPTSKDKGH